MCPQACIFLGMCLIIILIAIIAVIIYKERIVKTISVFLNYFWLPWVSNEVQELFVAGLRLFLVAGSSLLHANKLLVAVDSFVEEHGLSYPVACGIFLDQGSNPCP